MAPQQPSPASTANLPSSSSLPFPSSLRHNRSFVKLANLLGLASNTGSSSSQDDQVMGLQNGAEKNHTDGTDEELEDEDEDGGGIDEDSLMWDAQTALIAHQPALAVQNYTLAALPPYRSAPACLALGNLLTRGSGLAPPAQTPGDPARYSAAEKGKGRSHSFGPASPSQSVPTSPRQDQRRGSAATTSLASPPRTTVGRFMDFVWPSSPTSEAIPESPPDRMYIDLVGIGWAIPKEGKRAVRDVEGMGIAGGWFVLGLGWIVDGQVAAAARTIEAEVLASDTKSSMETDPDEDTIIIGSKLKGKSRQISAMRPVELVVKIRGQEAAVGGDGGGGGETSSEGTLVKTPPEEAEEERRAEVESTVKLIYDLLQPLLRLYRNGHIQSSDPVYLPPITYAQLPSCVRPQGDLQKRKNVWNLGGTVLKKLLDLKIMQDGVDEKRGVTTRRRGVEVMARYILAMTGPSSESEDQYRQIINLGHSGLEYPDEIVRHAAKHLDILGSPPLKSPPPVPFTSRRAEYPFPSMIAPTAHLQAPKRSFTSPSQIRSRTARPSRRTQQLSISSIHSFSSANTARSIKTAPSIASLAESSCEVDLSPKKKGTTGAADTLRRLQAQSVVDLKELGRRENGGEAWWPSLSGWSYSKSREKSSPISSAPESPSAGSTVAPGSAKDGITSATQSDPLSASIIVSLPTPSPMDTPETQLQIPTIRTVASTPTFGSLRISALQPKLASSGTLTPRPFDHLHNEINTTMDPALAAAELASTLTKRIKCGVCRIEGINFPECRKCGLTFCSRECRVGEDKAGNGKKHVCGAWESRKGLCVPERVDGRRGSKSAGVAGRVLGQPEEVMAC